MAESIQGGLVQATQVARETAVRQSPNGIQFAAFGETGLDDVELARMVQAVPATMAAALEQEDLLLCAAGDGGGARVPRRWGIAVATRRR